MAGASAAEQGLLGSVWGQAALSGLLAGLAATAVTVLIERCGGLIGGVIGTTPSTILPAAVGIAAAAASQADLTIAMFTVPMAMACDVLLLASWRVLPSRLPQAWPAGTTAAALAALSLAVWALPAASVWALTSLVLTTAEAVTVAGALTTAATAAAGVAATWQMPPTPPGRNAVPCRVLAVRGMGAGVSIFAAVLVSRTSPALGGLVSAFPAIFLTTMVSVYLAQGADTTVGAVGPMVLGSTSVSLFACCFAAIQPAAGTWPALGAAYCIAIALASVPATLWLQWRRRASAAGEAASDQAILAAPAPEADSGVLTVPGLECDQPSPLQSETAGGTAVLP
ncbi:hypothetical protein FNF31_01643 [Cafeteria roenbergensis]|uniref:Uncharacterized protein n=1 Tax=Cafeteria roenbergensis TaxID=33653 RepID=A0A5A8DQ92_CAFRO|nr:hypothetical protein FNF31_01643 [Cafeteria roenbergensis]